MPFWPGFDVTRTHPTAHNRNLHGPLPPWRSRPPDAPPPPTSSLSDEVLFSALPSSEAAERNRSYSGNKNLTRILLRVLPASPPGYIHVVLIPPARCNQPGAHPSP